MPKAFHSVVKYCENCGKQLTLRNTRDIERKRFCSRRCFGLVGIIKENPKHNELTKSRMRKPHSFKDKKLWLINLKKGHEGVTSPFKGRHSTHSTWGKRIWFNGITFRSTWEAYLAKLLTEQNIKYIYESKRFNLGKITFLPDFYLPNYNLYIEVKGYMDERSKERINLFKSLYPEENLILFTLKSIQDSGMSQWKVWKLFSESEV